MFNDFRFEFAFKDLNQLSKKVDFFKNNNIYKLNIPCKGELRKDFLYSSIEYLGNNFNELDIVYHYSFFHQFYKSKTLSLQMFYKFIGLLEKFKNKEILLISGTNKKKDLQVKDILNDLCNSDFKIKFGVAYNPYFSERVDIVKERESIIKKLKSSKVNSIWLQFGSNLNFLKREVQFLEELKFEYQNSFNIDLKIYGSLFVPSKQFLARFKFRPWKGVYLSNKYLNSIDEAIFITKNILNFYHEHNIEPLIESECCSKKQLSDLINLLSKYENQ